MAADFYAEPLNGTPPLEVQFTDTTLGQPSCWNWSFGDGTWFNTTLPSERNPTHTYTGAGNYTVKLLTSNEVTWDTEEKSDYILIPISAFFTTSGRSGYAPLEVTFTDQSTGVPVKWTWDFGDGATSDEQHTVHEYTKPGVYNVTLSVESAYGAGATATREGWVMVYLADTGGGGKNSKSVTSSEETKSTVTVTVTATVVPPDSSRADTTPAETPSGVTDAPAVPAPGDTGGIPLLYIAVGILLLVLIAGLALVFLRK
jgi:PKD repeat protein